jgi:hypothetical protein
MNFPNAGPAQRQRYGLLGALGGGCVEVLYPFEIRCGAAEVGGWDIWLPDGTLTNRDEIDVNAYDLGDLVDEVKKPPSSGLLTRLSAKYKAMRTGPPFAIPAAIRSTLQTRTSTVASLRPASVARRLQVSFRPTAALSMASRLRRTMCCSPGGRMSALTSRPRRLSA